MDNHIQIRTRIVYHGTIKHMWNHVPDADKRKGEMYP